MAGLLVPAGLVLPRLLRAATIATGFDYYISTTGSDSNPGTLAQPWAITSLSPYASSPNYSKVAGKRIGLLPGTYGVSSILTKACTYWNNIGLDLPSGTATASTYLASCDANGNYSPLTATIKGNDNGYYGGGNNNQGSMIGHSGTGYVTFDGLVISGASMWGLTIGATAGTNYSPPGIIIQNCEFTGNNASQMTASGLNGQNCAPLQIMSGNGVLIQNNYIHDNVGYPQGSYGVQHFAAIYHWGYGSNGTRGTKILYNTIVNSGCLHGKEATQYDTEIAYNYIDMRGTTPGTPAGYTANIVGFLADSGRGTLTTIHHNVLISYDGGASDGPSALGGAWIDLTFDTGQSYWDYPVRIYNNTCIASSSLNGCGCLAFEKTAGSRLFTFYNNLFYDAGYNAVGQYGWWFTNADAFALCDYNVYGTTQGSRWASFASNGSQDTVGSSVASFAAWRAAIGNLDAHSTVNSGIPFVGSGTLAAAYQVVEGTAAYRAGRVGGVASGAVCNVGAWDGPVTQIGCNFAGESAVPKPPGGLAVS